MNTLWTSTPLPDDVKECVRKHRTMSEIIRDLGEQHERHVLDIAQTEARYDAWSAHIDALWENYNG